MQMSTPATPPDYATRTAFIEPPARPAAKWRKAIGQLLYYALVFLVVAITFFPIYWMIVSAIRPSEYSTVFPPKLYPESMVGWSNAGHGMANVPGPFRRILKDIADAL